MGLTWLTMEVFKHMLEEGSYAICSEPILPPSPRPHSEVAPVLHEEDISLVHNYHLQ